MSDLGFNVWGAIGSAVGILALIPVFLTWLQPRLPRSMLPNITETHKEAKELFATALSQGLITDPADLYEFHVNILDASIRVDEVRAAVYRIRSWKQDAGEWWSGLSSRMYVLRKDLNSLRIKLAERNSHELKKLASQGLAGQLAGISDNKESAGSPLPDASLSAASTHLAPGPELGRHEATALPKKHTPMPFSPPSIPQNVPRESERSPNWSSGEVNPCIDASASAVPATLQDQQRPAPTSRSESTHHFVSDSDLHELLSLALTRPCHSLCRHKHARAGTMPCLVPKAANLKRLRGSSAPKGGSDAVLAKRHARWHSRLRSLLNLVRRVYGARLDSRGVAKGGGTGVPAIALGLDPESLTPQYAEEGDSDGESDGWEECQ
ncbi:hypothetical protein FKP32DRAFT_92810 [Trametes sanguinea]|nr:hypothetical protein FKP32DRAFT_92810 [Trametes sanguinea]